MAATSQAQGTMELWLDQRRTATVAEHGAPIIAPIIAPSRLELFDATIVDDDNRDDQIVPTSALPTTAAEASSTKRYVARIDPNDDGNDRPTKLFCGGGNGNSGPVGAIVDVSTPSGQDAALGLVGSVEWIVITWCRREGDDGGQDDGGSWIMIPAENLISSCHNTGTKIAAAVDRVGDVGGLTGALELGVDALCIGVADAADDENGDLWDALVDAKEERRRLAAAVAADDAPDDGPSAGPTIVQGTCRRVAPRGGKSTVLADRVCIDLVQTLAPTEGCWIGSSAKIMALVLSEAARSDFVPSRPFRVNAGPVHSYVVMGDGVSTKYLSELAAGDEVLVFDVVSGGERAVAVGRLKVEVRPCVQCGLFAAATTTQSSSSLQREGKETYGHDGQVFLQQAETVRLGQTLGDESFLRITDLEYKENDVQASSSDVLLRVANLGTHVGRSYSGKVAER